MLSILHSKMNFGQKVNIYDPPPTPLAGLEHMGTLQMNVASLFSYVGRHFLSLPGIFQCSLEIFTFGDRVGVCYHCWKTKCEGRKCMSYF